MLWLSKIRSHTAKTKPVKIYLFFKGPGIINFKIGFEKAMRKNLLF
jgi:hypothetical protein